MRTSSAPNERATLICGARAASEPASTGWRHAALGHQRGDQRRRRDVEGWVAAAASGRRQALPRRRCGPRRRRAPRSRSAAPVGQCGSIVEVGPGDDERDPGRARGEREAVRADLVGHVAVGGDAVAADDHGVELAAGDQPRRGGVDRELVRDPELAQLVHGQPGTLEQRPRLGGDDAASSRRARHSSAITASAVPRPGAASAPVLQCVSTRRRRRGGRRRWRRSPRWRPPPRRGSPAPRRARRGRWSGRRGPDRCSRTRSTA